MVTTRDGASPVGSPGRAGALPATDLEPMVDTDEDVNWNPADGLELARAKANENLAAALVGIGWSTEGAGILARACVRPDDVRRRLSAPVELRVPGGTMLVVESTVFSHGVTTYPTNLRELGVRRYPLGIAGDAAEDKPITDPSADPDHSCELLLEVGDRSKLSEQLRSSETWLHQHNPLADEVGVEGVLQPVTLAGMRVDHRDGGPSVHLLTAVDGSSRTTAAHRLLGADPADLVYGKGSTDRQLRQEIGNVLRPLHELGWTGLTEIQRRQVRAVAMPARIIVGYRQEPGRGVGFDAAVRSLIGLMHIAPPRPYGAEVERDAIGDAVLDVLQQPHKGNPGRITKAEARWFAALASPRECKSAGLPWHEDVRAAEIIRVFTYGGRRTTLRVNAGIRSITARSSPKPDERVAIAVELILRPWRTAHAGDERLNMTARRSALQRAYGLPQIALQPDESLIEGGADSTCNLEALRDQALTESSEGRGRRKDLPLGRAQVELAVKAAYYLILANPMGLRREAPPNVHAEDKESDNRSPSAVLTAMLSTGQGVLQAYEVIKCGRAGSPLWEVNEHGHRSSDADGNPVVLTNGRLRSTYGGKTVLRAPKSGAAAAEHQWDALEHSMTELERVMADLTAVQSPTGRSYLDEHGWPSTEIEAMRHRLDGVDHRLRGWQDRWATRQADQREDDEDSPPEDIS